jgi:multimeric flavodoxin WrbA
MAKVRKGQWSGYLSRAEFQKRFRNTFSDPAFEDEREAIERLEAIAWRNYMDGRKSPVTKRAGRGFADPEYELSTEWADTHHRLQEAASKQQDPMTPSRVLLICAAARNDGTCPGEMSKSFRLTDTARAEFAVKRIDVDVLDLSLLSSDYSKRIYPCKGCVSTAMPLCHWPCSCYPNHALGQANDWMAEIYERWTAAHGVLIVAPVYWYQAPSTLKLMMDRMVCADGGNPDPTSTSGKNPEKAKALELANWPYPKHLKGRVYGLVVHGDTTGIEVVRRALTDWLDTLGLIDAGFQARIDRFIGYYQPYATSHDSLDKDKDLFEEVRNVARAVANAIAELRGNRLSTPDAGLDSPRQK